MRIFFIILLSVLFFGIASAGDDGMVSSQKYIIVFRDDTVGNFTVSKSMVNDTVVYLYQSVADIRVFKKYHVDVFKKTKYHNNRLIHSFARNIVNGKTRDETITTWNPQKMTYINNKDGDITEDNRPITFSGVRMFFDQPVNEKTIFSELRVTFDEVSRGVDDSFEVNYGFRGGTTYFYKQGEPYKLIVDYFVVDFEMFRVNN